MRAVQARRCDENSTARNSTLQRILLASLVVSPQSEYVSFLLQPDNILEANGIKSLLILLIPLFAVLVAHYRRTRLLPPGPKGLPILGNIHGVQPENGEPPWITYLNLSRIYGDIFTYNVLGHRTIVLSSYEAITELLERRSHNYSDRP
ncbi:hypothetical protein PM082_015126, partial [Marasmius tenuissimus]